VPALPRVAGATAGLRAARLCSIAKPEAGCRFPTLSELHPEEEIVVIDDAGAVWQAAPRG